MKKLTYDDFLEKYKPVENHIDSDAAFDGCMFETYGDELEYIEKTNPKNIWTIIETDNDFSLIAGYHYVNRYGYFITEKQWKDKDLDIEIPIYEDDDNEFIID